jgi:pimeloyl-ACP methyl ester carboxylesterase
VDVNPELLAWRDAGQRLDHRGNAIFYRAGGAQPGGPTLLCVHGLPTASWDWHLVWPALEAAFARVLAPDMIGFGFSAKPPRYPYSIFDQADIHERLLRAHGITRYRMLAHDYGVTVAQELLARHEERLARRDHSLVLEAIVFLNGGLFPETHRALPIQKLMLTPLGPLLARATSPRLFARSFSRVFGPHTKPTAGELAQFYELFAGNGGSRIAHRLFHYMPERVTYRERWVRVLCETAVPRRMINGSADPVSGAHAAARYRELVPGADIVALPDIGHYPQVEAPDAVLAAALPALT